MIELTISDLRTVAAFAANCTRPCLTIFEEGYPADRRPEAAIEAAADYAAGGPRSRNLREAAWKALEAARTAKEDGNVACYEAARAAAMAAGSGFLHPLVRSTQVRHILGPAAHCARAFEIRGDGDPGIGDAWVDCATRRATFGLVSVLRRFPAAPAGGGRVGEMIRNLDRRLRQECDGWR